MSTVAVQVVNEKGQSNSFCRAGITFGPDVGFYEVDDEQLERIQEEPKLIVAVSSRDLKGPAAVELLQKTADLVLINEFYGDEERKSVTAAVEERIGELEAEKQQEPEEGEDIMPSKRVNAGEAIKAIQRAPDVDSIKRFIKDDDRKTVLDAAEKKIAELEAAGAKG